MLLFFSSGSIYYLRVEITKAGRKCGNLRRYKPNNREAQAQARETYNIETKLIESIHRSRLIRRQNATERDYEQKKTEVNLIPIFGYWNDILAGGELS